MGASAGQEVKVQAEIMMHGIKTCKRLAWADSIGFNSMFLSFSNHVSPKSWVGGIWIWFIVSLFSIKILVQARLTQTHKRQESHTDFLQVGTEDRPRSDRGSGQDVRICAVWSLWIVSVSCPRQIKVSPVRPRYSSYLGHVMIRDHIERKDSNVMFGDLWDVHISQSWNSWSQLVCIQSLSFHFLLFISKRSDLLTHSGTDSLSASRLEIMCSSCAHVEQNVLEFN